MAGWAPDKVDPLYTMVYDELHALAARLPKPGSIRTTSIVHELYVRFADRPEWESKRHFFVTAASALRNMVIDRIRRDREYNVPAKVLEGLCTDDFCGKSEEFEEIDLALARLETIHPEAAQIALLRVFAGLQIDEIADVLGVSRRTVFRKWELARALLFEFAHKRDPGSGRRPPAEA